MATFSFNRPFKLTPEGTERFLKIASKPVEPDGIEPYSEVEQEKSKEIIKKWFESQRNKK